MDAKKSDGMSRRSFMKGVAAMAPLILPASVLGGRDAVAAGERLTFGLIGCGGQGNGDIGGVLSSRGTQVVAVCDVNRKSLEETKAKIDKHYDNTDCAAYKDFRELLARKDIDAVVIATPDHWHALIAIEAARQGKDIYCEKPLAWSLGEGRAVVEAVKANNRILQVGSQQRSGSEFKYACEVVRNGYLGKVRHINVGLPNGGNAMWVDEYPAPPETLDYDFYVGPAEWAPYHKERLDWNWRWWMGFGGGQMMDWIGHHGDIAHMGMGWDAHGPCEVEPVLWEMSPERNNLYNGPAKYIINYTYDTGTTMQVASRDEMPEVFKNCEDTGTQWFGEDGKWIFVSRKGIHASSKDLLKIKFKDGDFRFRKERNHMRDFLDCIRERREPAAPAETAHRSASIGQLGRIAVSLGCKLKWDPKAEKFIDNEAVNSLITRKYRGEWKLS